MGQDKEKTFLDRISLGPEIEMLLNSAGWHVGVRLILQTGLELRKGN